MLNIDPKLISIAEHKADKAIMPEERVVWNCARAVLGVAQQGSMSKAELLAFTNQKLLESIRRLVTIYENEVLPAIDYMVVEDGSESQTEQEDK